MHTKAQSPNYALFIALLLVAALVGLLGAYLADGQVVDGEFTFHVVNETPDLERVGGSYLLEDGQILVISQDGHKSRFDGEEWHEMHSGYYARNVAGGPDGKVWLKSFWKDDTGYIDVEGFTPVPWKYRLRESVLIEVEQWRGQWFLIIGSCMKPYGSAFAYCDPSCFDMRGVFGVSAQHAITGCCISGDFAASASSLPLRIENLVTDEVWDLSWRDQPNPRLDAPVGTNSYFWVLDEDTGILQIDAIERMVEPVAWSRDCGFFEIALDWRGLWVYGWSKEPQPSKGHIALWALHDTYPEVIRVVSRSTQVMAACATDRGSDSRDVPRSIYPPTGMAITHIPELWFYSPDGMAMVKWTPDPDLIPMPYEARVNAEMSHDGLISVTIEIENLRIIRNDADLWMTVECFREGEEEPMPLSETYSLYYQFQPNETYLYACEYVPVAPPSVDRIRCSLWTTVACTGGETVSSNVAAAEVRLD